MPGRRFSMRGVIASAGFASGDRVVVGHWTTSPIGPFSDVMWGHPDGTTTLLASSVDDAEFITAVYRFDRCEIVGVVAAGDDAALRVVAGGLAFDIVGGRLRPIPFRRPAWFTRLVEGPIASLTMGVHTYGTSPTGVREWYRADGYRPATHARAWLDGADLGEMVDVDPPLGVGFSEPPRRPALVAVRPLLEDPSGLLDEVVSRRR